MSAIITKKEGYKTQLEISISPEDFKKGIIRAYNKTKGKYSVQGFRKGKVPQYIIERVYGGNVFFEEAIDILFAEQYPNAIDETEIHPIDHPSIDIKEIGLDEGLVLIVDVDEKPKVKLGKYKSVKIEKIDVKVIAKDVNKALKAEAEKNSRMITVEDRPAKKDDTVIIDFEGFIDDVPFKGGKSENFKLVIGSGQFISGFEDQIIGKNTDDEFDVNVTFPEEYQAEDLKSKKAVFKVKLNEIKETEVPELDDEFAKDVSEFDTLQEYKADLKKSIMETRSKKAEDKMKSAALDAAVGGAEVDIPPAMIERRIDENIREFEMRISYQGMKLDDYLEKAGMKKENLREQYKETSANQIKLQLVVEEISKIEKIEADEEDREARIKEDAKRYGMSVEDYKKDLNDDNMSYLDEGIVYEKTIDLIYENAVKTKAAKKTVEKKKDETE